MKKRVVSIILTLSMLLPTVNVVTYADGDEISEENVQLQEVIDDSKVGTDEAIDEIIEEKTIIYEPVLYNEDENASGNDENQNEGNDEGNPTPVVTDLSTGLTGGNVEIDTDGKYSIADVTTANTITVKENTSAELTITDLVITGSTTAPICVEAGATLTLYISGTSILTAPSNYAGISVKQNGTIIINGDGTLNATGGNNSAGIGSSKTDVNGKIVINGGTVNATGIGAYGVGIGRCNSTTVGGDIEINGGTVTATSSGTYAPAIGSGKGENGKITINGGYIITSSNSTIGYTIGPAKNYSKTSGITNIYINGGSIVGSFRSEASDKVQNDDGDVVVKREITLPTGCKNKEVTVDDWTSVTDDNGKLYVYVTSNVTSYAVECDGKQYYTSDITSSDPLTEVSGVSCTCGTDGTVALTIDDEIRVNKIDGKTSVRITATYTKAETCQAEVHKPTYSYTITDTDGNAVSSDVAELKDGYIEVKYNAGVTNIVRVNAKATVEGNEYIAYKDVSIISDDTSKFDLSSGNIVVKKGSATDTLTVTVGSDTYTVADDGDIYIYQTSAKTTNTIEIQQGVTSPVMIFDGLNIISDSSLKNILTIGDGVGLTLKLKDINYIESQSIQLAAIKGISSSSTLTIEDYGDNDGVITFKSKNGAGIGTLSKLTVNSGTVYAYGGSGSAGIGGNSDGNGFNVLINGGSVYAYGDSESGSNASGIGGGTGTALGSSGKGGNVIINGGYVKAVGSGTGKGIGNGGNATQSGNITINGGSVDATLGTTPNNDPDFNAFTSSGSPNKKYNQYLVETTIEGITDVQDVECSIMSDDDVTETKFKTRTDDSGKLYLYANAGKEWVRVYKGSDTYYRYSRVESMQANNFRCIKNIVISITDFKIAGQTSDTVINSNTKTITVKVPYNIMLDEKVKPKVTFEGSFTDETIDFNNTTTGTFAVIGDDKSSVEYTVTLELENTPTEPQKDTYDVSKGTVCIFEDYVRYGDVYYKPNTLGYIITGTTTENNIVLDATTYENELPPITLKNLDIQLNNSATALKCVSNANVTIEGKCNLSSALGFGISVENDYYKNPTLAITSGGSKPLENMLTVTGGVNKSAVSALANTKLSVTGVPTVLTAKTSSAVASGSDLVTDCDTYIKLDESSQSTVKNANGDLLYQLCATLKGVTEEKNVCTYNDVDYYIGSDHVLYIMSKNGTYSMTVKYDDVNYNGDVEVNSAKTEVDLYSTYVETITYDSTTMNNKGGEVVFTLTGKSLDGNVTIKVVSREDPPQTLTDVVTLDNDTGKYTAKVELPINTSTETPVVYDVYYVIRGKDTKCDNALTVDYDKAVGRITAFGIEGQVGQTTIYEDTHTITVYMPYDHEYKQYYKATTLDFIGKSVDPAKDKEVEFYADNGGFVRKEYTVTAKDNTTKVKYTAKVYKQATPKVTSLKVPNSTTGEATTLTVTINGKSLNNLKYAENDKNRKIYIYSNDGIDAVEATYSLVDGNDVYTAVLNIPENESDTQDKIYSLKVKIGDIEQNINETQIRVPRKERGLVGITEFMVDNQIGDTVVSGENGKNISITMPFDADITEIIPYVTLEDMYATYTPNGEQDFTNDVVYTVTAENKTTTKDYTVHIEKQAKPVATGLTFTNPENNSGGSVQVVINGNDLPNAENALINSRIALSATLVSGDVDDSAIKTVTAKLDDNGNYVATLIVPTNYNTVDARVYTLSVNVCGEEQTLSGNVTLTVPRRLRYSKDLTDFILIENQGQTVKDGNKWYVYVPYNTNLNGLTPKLYHTGEAYTPTDARDFDETQEYTIIAEDGSRQAYQITAVRDTQAQVTNVTVDKKPTTFKDTKGFTLDIKGYFIPYLKDGVVMDTVVANAVLRDDGSSIPITLTFDGYGGHATGTFNLPENTDTEASKVYDVEITVNGTVQQIGTAGEITVPRRKTRAITKFAIDNQVGETVIDNDKNEITVTMPYDTDIKKLTPTVEIDGDDYSPKGEQNFKNSTKSLEYTVSAADDTDRKYTVKILRDSVPTLDNVTFVSPRSFKGGNVTVDLEGIFFDTASVTATDDDGNAISDSVVLTEDKKATLTLNIPINDSQEEKTYTLSFNLDGFATDYTGDKIITVPRRTTRLISEFTLPGDQNGISIQEGETVIDGTDIYIESPYVCDLSAVVPHIEFDADTITPAADAVQNFNNDVKYTLSSLDDEDVVYTVHVKKIGEDPYLNTFTVTDQYSDTVYDGDNIKLVVKRSVNIEEIEPILDFVGSDYEPKGLQNFADSLTTPLEYIIKNKYGVEHKYYVTITRKKTSSSNKGNDVEATPTPTPSVSPTPTPSEEIVPTIEPEEKKYKPYINGYEEDGRKYFSPDSNITRAEIAKILATLDDDFDENKSYTSKFADVREGTWYRNYVNFAVMKGYMSGDQNGECRPEDFISRAEFASMIARYVDADLYDGKDKFSDIARFDWCRSDINSLAEENIVSGYTDGTFMPDNRLTRGEAVAIINRAIGREMTEELIDVLSCPFDDVSKLHWAYNDILLASCEY